MVEEVNKEDEDTATEVPEPLEDGEFDEELQLEEAVDDEVIDVEDESAAAAGAPSSTSSSCSSCIRGSVVDCSVNRRAPLPPSINSFNGSLRSSI